MVMSILLSAVLLASVWQVNISTADGGVVTKKIVPESTGELYNNWLVFPANTDKAAAVADIDATDPLEKYIYRDANAKRQTFDLTTNEIPPGVTTITNVKIVALAKSGLATDKIQLTMVKGTTSANISDGPLIPVYAGTCLTEFCEVVRDLGTTNPLTNSAFTVDDINFMTANGIPFEVGVNNQQQQNSVLQVTELYMVVQYPDPDPPDGTITIDNDAPGTTDPDVDVTLTCNDNGGSGCASVDITVDGTTTTQSISDTPPAAATTVQVTLPAGRGEKTVTAVFKDVAGNSSSESDTILLSSTLTSSEPDDPTPTWGVNEVTVSGTVTNPADGDQVNVDWGSPNTTVPIDENGAWEASFVYPKESMDDPNPHNIVVSQVDADDNPVPVSAGGADPVDAGSITLQKQFLSLFVDDITSPGYGTAFTVAGNAIGEDGNGAIDIGIAFGGNGADVPDAVDDVDDTTTGGITIGSDIIVDSPPDYILRLDAGDTITLPPNAGAVQLYLKDMGNNKLEVTGISGLGNPFGPLVGAANSGGTVNFGIQNNAGISSITVSRVLDSSDVEIPNGIAGISKIIVSNNVGKSLGTIDFATEISPAVPSISFGEGIFSSSGTAPGVEGVGWQVDVTAASNNYYEGAAASVTYDTVYRALGFGGGTPPVDDAGNIVAQQICDPFVDTDGDAICDDWELNGIPYGAGSRYLLPGADVNTDNIWLEIDYMQYHPPQPTAIANVIQAFAYHNIILTVDTDEEITHLDTIAVWTDIDADATNDFDSIKTNHFGTTAEQADTAMLGAKKQAYRYQLFVHGIGGSTGAAELLGNDSIVSLGGPLFGVDGAGTYVGTINQHAGTIMHELGHNLNLAHGGPDNLITEDRAISKTDTNRNCKPHYPSVMSYSRQYDNYLGADWVLDYSTGHYSTLLFETNLPAALSLLSSTTTRPITWGTPGVGSGYLTTSLPLSNIDWNGNGSTPDTGLSSDVNNFGIFGCGATPLTSTQSMKDWNDWGNLDFKFQDAAAGFFDGVYTEIVPESDDLVIQQQLIDSNNFIGLVPPPELDGSETRKGGAQLPIKVDFLTNTGQSIFGATLTVSFYSIDDPSINAGPFIMAPRVGDENFYQYDWKTPNVSVNTYVYILVEVERPGDPPTQILLLDPANEIDDNPDGEGNLVTNRVLLTP